MEMYHLIQQVYIKEKKNKNIVNKLMMENSEKITNNI